jgi:hypothetical protein
VPFILSLSLYFYLGYISYIKKVKDSDSENISQMNLKIEAGLVVLLLSGLGLPC